MKRFFKILLGLTAILLIGGFLYLQNILLPGIDRKMNVVQSHDPYAISKKAKVLHDSLYIADLHSDSLLWERNPVKRHDYGHVDLPRIREGQVNFQIFSAVTKSPKGQNFDGNDADAPDNITRLAQAQLWPVRTWGSLYERAAYQAQRLQKIEKSQKNNIVIARRKSDMLQDDPDVVVTLLLTEGSHPLEGKIENIARLHDEGYRAMGLQHFFDNELGGSMHGRSQAGLSDFGRKAVAEMDRQSIMVDLAHSSEAVARDVLALIDSPVFISHGGTVSHCPRTANRNLPDDVLKQIAERGGIIGIGFFSGAICDISPDGIASAITDAVNVLGADAVALGSDFDGTVTTTLDISEMAVITQSLLERRLSETTIRKVMGENARRYFSQNLPD